MKTPPKIPVLTTALCALPAEFQPEVATFLEEHRNSPALAHLETAFKNHLNEEVQNARRETLAECRKVYLDKMDALEVRIFQYTKVHAANSPGGDAIGERLLEQVDRKVFDQLLRFGARQQRFMLTIIVLASVALVAAFVAITHRSSAGPGEAEQPISVTE